MLIGLLIRLAFMPFTLHGDLVGINWFAYCLVHQGHIPLRRMNYPPLAYFTAYFFQLLFRPVMPLFEQWSDSVLPWFSGPHLFRYVFLLKSYYLIFDLGVAFLLPRLIADNQRKLLAFKLWMLNPIVILVSYMQGQFDVLSTFFVILSLYYVAAKKFCRSLFFLGIGAALKQFPLLFLIPALTVLGRTKAVKFKLLLCGIVPYILLMYPYWGSPTFRKAVTTVAGMDEFVLYFHFDLGNVDKAYVYIVGYTIILALAYFHSRAKDSKEAFETLWRVELIILLWLYTTIFFLPQYFVWVTPLLILFSVENKKVRTLYWLQIICVFVHTLHWDRYLPDLFTPLDPAFFPHIPSPFYLINRYYPVAKFMGIFRSVFSGICLWMIYLILREFFLVKKEVLR